MDKSTVIVKEGKPVTSKSEHLIAEVERIKKGGAPKYHHKLKEDRSYLFAIDSVFCSIPALKSKMPALLIVAKLTFLLTALSPE